MNVMAFATHDQYSLAEMVARRLEREERIERHPYDVPANFHFDLCEWCDGEQHPALFDWQWDRIGAVTDGHARSCGGWDCARKVLSFAQAEAYPEGVSLEHAVLAEAVQFVRPVAA